MWKIEIIDAAQADLRKLDNSARQQVYRAIDKVAQNPQPKNEGGYGEPLGNKGSLDLRGYLKIKLRASGIRVVYRISSRRDRRHYAHHYCRRAQR